MLKALNSVTRFGEPVVYKDCSANDICWFCDTKDLCKACDTIDLCMKSDT